MLTKLTHISFLIFVLLMFSCKETPKEKQFVLNGNNLKTLVINYFNGDVKSKKLLKGLFSFSPNSLNELNKILIDSISINNKTFYYLILEHQNPIYNLFAIVDKDLNLILKDESLNGYLNLTIQKNGSRIFAVLDEEFKSKDIIELKRSTFYSVDEYSADIVFRQFTHLKSEMFEANQKFSIISDTTIVTEITTIPVNKINQKDVFHFDVASNKYLSENNYFDSLVFREIRNHKTVVKGLQINDEESINVFYNGENPDRPEKQIITDINDYSITLDANWKRLGTVTISNLVKRKIKGIKYIHSKTGAIIYLSKIASTDSAENYFNEELRNIAKFKSNLRFSEKLVDSNTINRLFEFACPSKKMLMILITPKNTLDEYDEIYQKIIKSFKVKC